MVVYYSKGEGCRCRKFAGFECALSRSSSVQRLSLALVTVPPVKLPRRLSENTSYTFEFVKIEVTSQLFPTFTS